LTLQISSYIKHGMLAGSHPQLARSCVTIARPTIAAFGVGRGRLARPGAGAISFAFLLFVASFLVVCPNVAAPEETDNREKSERAQPPAGADRKSENSASPEPSGDDKSSVSLSGQVAEDSAGPHGVIRFWLTIDNRSAQPIRNIQLAQPQIRGFRLAGLCWPGNKVSECPDLSGDAPVTSPDAHPGKPPASPQPLIDLQSSLEPGQAVTVWGYLEAIKTTRKEIAFLTVSWDGPAHSSKTVGLGEVESLSVARAFFLFFTNNWEWTFPILLPVLTFLGSRLLKRREGKRKARAEELSHRQRTWSLMLKQAQPKGNARRGWRLLFQRSRWRIPRRRALSETSLAAEL
jgi:hypothetical protein